MMMRDVNQDERLKDAAFQKMKDEIDRTTRTKNEMKKAKAEGFTEGKKEGILQGKQEGIALVEEKYRKDNKVRILQMIEDGLDESLIVKYCQCTLEEIDELKKRL